MKSENYRSLEDTIGYRFRDPGLLAAALTHSSYSNEKKSKGIDVECNERLEFLGDSVLSIITSTYLYGEYENFREGDLTKTRAAVVCEKALSKYAGEIGLGKYIFLGHGEEMNRGRERASITADAFEALLAAVYIDSGFDIDAVRTIVLPFIKEEIEAIRTGSSFEDCKTALQHIVQQVNSEKLEYVLVGESGPDHDKIFEVEARLNSNVIGRGKARSKREAEQLAAKEALRLFGEK
ncbi:MAG: ribonuclease III [Clostridia bacterium]|nr:ribonuclease III [Clostridia bacterium]